MVKYRCTSTVSIKRGGELIGQDAFLYGQIYAFLKKEYGDIYLINEFGQGHPMTEQFFKSHFELHEESKNAE